MTMKIISMQPEHWDQVKTIYEQGIATGHATFQTSAPEWDEWNESHLAKGRLIAIDENSNVLGWAALTPVSGRCVYAGVAEVSVYLSESARGKGIGKTLLAELIGTSERDGFWTLQAGVLRENISSIKIHEACGFHIVGVRERLGQLKGTWRDVVLLERRSLVVGV
ncbi:MAG: N-acetyltransferase [Cyclobacteriaceae bacterium]|nr:N-acetyltransferase [Cyclobacteriaceae bacterium]